METGFWADRFNCDKDFFVFYLRIPKIYLCSYLFGIINMYVPGCIVALLFYVHGKHLRSCRDGQLT